MPKRKPPTTDPTMLHIRVTPELRTAAVARAEAERRSLSNLIEVALLAYLDREVS